MTFDDLVESFRRLGMSPEAARVAAVGRADPYRGQARESEVRESWSGGSSAEIGRRVAAALSEAHPAAPSTVLEEEEQLRRSAQRNLGMMADEARAYTQRVKLREGWRGDGLPGFLRSVAAALDAARS